MRLPLPLPKGEDKDYGFLLRGGGSFQKRDFIFSTPHLSPLLDRGREEIVSVRSVTQSAPTRSSRCLLVRNLSADRTIKLAVEIGRDQLRRPAAGTQTESQLAAERGFSNSKIGFYFAEELSQASRRISRGQEHFSRGANFL